MPEPTSADIPPQPDRAPGTPGESPPPEPPSGHSVGFAAAGPVEAAERLTHIDVLRGFALFGILQVNMTFFSQPLYVYFTDFTLARTAADTVAEFLVVWLFEGKFYALFSFLFGFGFALQMNRLRGRSDPFGRIYCRRLAVLLLLGAAHILLLWWGDILLLYALVGFVLLALRDVSNRTLATVVAVVYPLPVVVTWLFVGMISAAALDPTGTAQIEIGGQFRQAAVESQKLVEESIRIYSQGAWPEIFAHRLRNYRDSIVGILYITPTVLSMFLVGLYVARAGLLHDPGRHRRLLRALVVYGLPLGLLGNLLLAATRVWGSRTSMSWHLAAGQTVYTLTMPLLTFGYVAALVLAMQTGAGRALLGPVAAAGRMALTNYILQSVVCTTIFYSYGLGWFGKLSPAAGALLAVGIWVVQLPLSVLWLRVFRFGPLEWVWRSLTYWRWQPLRR